jgi:hypothetical protein
MGTSWTYFVTARVLNKNFVTTKGISGNLTKSRRINWLFVNVDFLTIFELNFKSEGTKRNIFVAFSPEFRQSHSECIFLLIAASRETEWLPYWAYYLQRIYCPDCSVCNWTVLTVITQKLLLHVQLHNSTFTVQTVQCTTELYLQQLHRSCCYMFSCTTVEKLSTWYLLKWNASGCLMLYVYMESHNKRSDPSDSRYWLQVQSRRLMVIRNKCKLLK